mmetsp:Transcript_8864/g.21526  ORF Transcript_8864/g.21526 Transcript_8864/m.21526 type:complete len:114 (-) Transcript_8864:60-401(-)
MDAPESSPAACAAYGIKSGAASRPTERTAAAAAVATGRSSADGGVSRLAPSNDDAMGMGNRVDDDDDARFDGRTIRECIEKADAPPVARQAIPRGGRKQTMVYCYTRDKVLSN